MEKYEVTLLNLTEYSEVNTVVYAAEAETNDNIILKTTINGSELTSESNQYLVVIKFLEISCCKSDSS